MDSSSTSNAFQKGVLRSRLRPYPNWSSLYRLALRMFQKSPALIGAFRRISLRHSTASYRKTAAKHFFLNIILAKTTGSVDQLEQLYPEESGEIEKGLHRLTTNKLENYLCFIDLSRVILGENSDKPSEKLQDSSDDDSEAEGNAKDQEEENTLKTAPTALTWRSYALNRFQAGLESEGDLLRLRKKVKKNIPEDFMKFVQVELDRRKMRKNSQNIETEQETEENVNDVSRVFLSVSIVKKSKRPRYQDKDHERLLQSRCWAFFAFYPNQPFIFTSASSPDPVVLDAIATAIGVREVDAEKDEMEEDPLTTPLDFFGPDLDGLARVLINRKNGEPKDAAPLRQRFRTNFKDLLGDQDETEHMSSDEDMTDNNRMVRLNVVKASFKEKFEGDRVLTFYRNKHKINPPQLKTAKNCGDNQGLPGSPLQLNFDLTLSGQDCLNSYEGLRAEDDDDGIGSMDDNDDGSPDEQATAGWMAEWPKLVHAAGSNRISVVADSATKTLKLEKKLTGPANSDDLQLEQMIVEEAEPGES